MKKNTILNNATIKVAMKKLNIDGNKSLVVIDKNNFFLGTLSDGDIRKNLLINLNLNKSISSIYKRDSFTINSKLLKIAKIKKIFLKEKYNLIPVIDDKKKLIKIILWDNFFKNKNISKVSTPVIIMAGGTGSRLQPFTSILPKPLLPINNKPVIDIILEYFQNYNLSKFYLTVNYKSDILKAYFKQKSTKINYVEENKKLGTAGPLSKLKNLKSKNLIICNCDVLFNLDLNKLSQYHIENNYDLTLVASKKDYKIPYGTCIIDKNNTLKQINEKPTVNILANTGLYVLKTSLIKLVPKNKFYDMNTYITDLISKNKKIGVYPIEDKNWWDVGNWDEYNKGVKNN